MGLGNRMRSNRKSCAGTLSPSPAVMRPGGLASFVAAAIALAPIGAAVAEDVTPLVSMDRIEDVPSTRLDPFPDFDNFAWRAFVALNWPSLTDPLHRGVPDPRQDASAIPARASGRHSKRVMNCFKSGQTGAPIAPAPWATYEALNPCGPDVDSRRKDARDLRSVHGFQPGELCSRRSRQPAGRAESDLYALRSAPQRTRVLGARLQRMEPGRESAGRNPIPRTCPPI